MAGILVTIDKEGTDSLDKTDPFRGDIPYHCQTVTFKGIDPFLDGTIKERVDESAYGIRAWIAATRLTDAMKRTISHSRRAVPFITGSGDMGYLNLCEVCIAISKQMPLMAPTVIDFVWFNSQNELDKHTTDDYVSIVFPVPYVETANTVAKHAQSTGQIVHELKSKLPEGMHFLSSEHRRKINESIISVWGLNRAAYFSSSIIEMNHIELE